MKHVTIGTSFASGFAALAVAELFAPGSAAAQPPGAGGGQPPVVDLGEEFTIEGRVQKPEAFFFLRRTPFGYVIRSLDEDFLDEVVRSVEGEPF